MGLTPDRAEQGFRLTNVINILTSPGRKPSTIIAPVDPTEKGFIFEEQFDGPLTLKQITGMKNHFIHERVLAATDFLGQSLTSVPSNFSSPALADYVDRSLATGIILPLAAGAEAPAVYAGFDDFKNIAAAESAGKISRDESFRLFAANVRLLQAAEKEHLGDVARISVESKHLERVGEFTGALSVDRAMAKAQHDFDVELVAIPSRPSFG